MSMDCYLLKLNTPHRRQSPDQNSFIGGLPKLPGSLSIPYCTLCGVEQSFFFQVAFPRNTAWGGLSLAVFACTSCAEKYSLIPQMPQGPLRDADIPAGFLESYQTNFRFLIFETASSMVRESYREKVAFNALNMEHRADADIDGNKIGGNPNWLMEDEAPKSYAEKIAMIFLLQVMQGFRFNIRPDAPRQIRRGPGGSLEPSPYGYYKLFNGNKIFLFGTEDGLIPLVYAITQFE